MNEDDLAIKLTEEDVVESSVKGSSKSQSSVTGKKYLRKKPILTATVNPVTLEMLHDLELQVDVPFSQIVDECIRNGVEKFKRDHVLTVNKPTPIDAERKRDEADHDKWMRKQLFDFKNESGRWRSV